MTPRIPMDTIVRDRVGAVDTTMVIPAFSAAKKRLEAQGFKRRGVDPVTMELVRMRNGRLQNCQVCQAFRDPVAQAAGASDDVLNKVDDYENSELPEAQKVALRLTDAYLHGPGEVSPQLRADLREYYTPAQIVQLLLRLTTTTSNRVLRALALDMDEEAPVQR